MSIEASQAVARTAAMRGQMARPLLNTLLVTFGFAIAVIVPARAWSFGRGWVLICLFFCALSRGDRNPLSEFNAQGLDVRVSHSTPGTD